MEQYDDTFEPVDLPPTIKEIEKRLRKLGCTKEQVSRHLDPGDQEQDANLSAEEARAMNRPHTIDWPGFIVRPSIIIMRSLGLWLYDLVPLLRASRRNLIELTTFWPIGQVEPRLFRCFSYSSLQHLLRVGANTGMTEHPNVNCSGVDRERRCTRADSVRSTSHGFFWRTA